MDYYLPQARLVFEINGKDHFYPYTFKKNNVTNLKSKLLREWGRSNNKGVNLPAAEIGKNSSYTVINLNVQTLEGLL